LTKIKQAGMERAGMPESAKQMTFYIYVDEFQNVVTQTFENILSEARKYGLNLTMAHQYVGQIIPKVHQAVLR
jgi:type IV secretory pathway TraG/TraD family ATPase VirD4